MDAISMNPDLVYSLVASNPSLKNLVEQTAKLYQLQQQAQQMTPMLQQMAQNPLGAVNSFANWQNQQASAQNQAPPQNQAPIQNQQQGGQPVGMFEQAMEIVGEFRKSFEVMNNNLKEVYDMSVANAEGIKALNGRLDEITSENKGAAKGARQKIISIEE